VRKISICESQEGLSTFIPLPTVEPTIWPLIWYLSSAAEFDSELNAATAHPSSYSVSTASSTFCICRGTTLPHPHFTSPCSALLRDPCFHVLGDSRHIRHGFLNGQHPGVWVGTITCRRPDVGPVLENGFAWYTNVWTRHRKAGNAMGEEQ
jgi:hypothetical protein